MVLLISVEVTSCSLHLDFPHLEPPLQIRKAWHREVGQLAKVYMTDVWNWEVEPNSFQS